MAKRTRWVQYDVPLFVRVEIDDAYADERKVTQVVLALDEDLGDPWGDPSTARPFGDARLARDDRGAVLVYDGDDLASGLSLVDDELATQAKGYAEYRHLWPPRDEWEEGPDPRRWPGLYDPEDGAEED